MAKEDNDKVNKGETDMSIATSTSKKTSFADFVAEHKEEIRKLSEANWKINSNGQHVILKNDPWRDEHEWDELNEELNPKK